VEAFSLQGSTFPCSLISSAKTLTLKVPPHQFLSLGFTGTVQTEVGMVYKSCTCPSINAFSPKKLHNQGFAKCVQNIISQTSPSACAQNTQPLKSSTNLTAAARYLS
jgi:hypothetical protein